MEPSIVRESNPEISYFRLVFHVKSIEKIILLRDQDFGLFVSIELASGDIYLEMIKPQPNVTYKFLIPTTVRA